MCDPTGGLLTAAVIGSAAVSAYQGEKSRKAQSQASTQARADADQAMNKANPKRPNLADMLYGNRESAAGGPGSTMATGPGGVDMSALTLGRSTLLGG